jgi:hypothetical protein
VNVTVINNNNVSGVAAQPDPQYASCILQVEQASGESWQMAQQTCEDQYGKGQ